ncbi:hypothetical protein ACIP5Y_45740 [Nocardia sp. NPDC088792]|uniref:hypothetical protein n=1 Tax=Nocardia sp. NPDC088792 TaxID=3364332 RepID=UPI0037F96281
MRKSVVVVALLALPLLSACSNSQQSAPATTSAAATTTTAAPTTSSGAPTTSPTTGPGATGGPSVSDISKALQDKGKLSQTDADCIANIYVQEGLSQSGIQKLIDDANTTQPTPTSTKIDLTGDDLLKAAKAAKRIATECTK